MRTELHWVEGPWTGRLALAARPRGGDWLADEMQAWHDEGADVVVSLLTPEEEADLAITGEADQTKASGMEFISFPIPDREVPASASMLEKTLSILDTKLAAGRNVVLHCRQGVGRTGTVAACLLLMRGTSPELAVRQLTEARGVTIPETEEQREWIDTFAMSYAH